MRESPVVILWLDNLGAFYPLIAEQGLSNIAAAFEGGTAVPHLIAPMPSVTEAAELVLKTGCGLDSLPVLGEVTFDRATRQHVSLKQTEFDRETGTVTAIEGAPKLADFVSPALARRLITNQGFTTCQIGWNLGQVGAGRTISLDGIEAVRLEYMASYDIIPLRIQTLLDAMQDHAADLYLLRISGDSIVHNEGLTGQVEFMKRLNEEFPTLMDGLASQAKAHSLIMLSDHGPRSIIGNFKPEEYLAGIEGLVFAGKYRSAAVVSNGRGSLYLYLRNPGDKDVWRRTAYRQLRSYLDHDILAAIAEMPQTSFVVCNREQGGIAILSSEGEATLSLAEDGVAYRLAWGKDPLGLEEIHGQVVSAYEMLMRTHDKLFPYPVQWLELMQAPCCGDVMIVVDGYAFFWDMPWVATTHGGPSRDEVGISLMAVGPESPETGIHYGQQIVSGSLRHLYSSLCWLLLGRPPSSLKPEADLLFGARQEKSQ